MLFLIHSNSKNIKHAIKTEYPSLCLIISLYCSVLVPNVCLSSIISYTAYEDVITVGIPLR